MNYARSTPKVLLDDATPGRERLRQFLDPVAVIEAFSPDQVPDALAAISRALRAGHHVAGYFAYELGYALEPRLRRLFKGDGPLLWFGVFPSVVEVADGDVRSALQGSVRGRAYAGPLAHEWSAAEYAARFVRARALIAAGDIYQVNLSFRSRFAFAGDPLALYLRLRERSQAAHGAFVDDGRRTVLSLSPELFFELSSDRRIVARPMKGTAPRADNDAADLEQRARLAASAKDRAENLMIVDLLRNDLSRVAESGSVDVPSLFAIETYPTLHQMVSTVTARVARGTEVEAIVRALFPCGSITGAPKIRAMEIIRELETGVRGVYCGAIGYFAPDGTARFNVAIRTATIANGQGELGIGGAVVYDSSAQGEYDECLLKARYFEGARVPLSLIETLGFSPERGLVRLPLHLARIERSARALGIPFCPDRAIAALEGAVASATAPRRVRLLLDESGAFTCTTTPLPPSPSQWRFALSSARIESRDALARHKTSWRETLDGEQDRLARATGADEVIFLNEKGKIAEGSRTNVFIARGGTLLTPPLSSGALDGCLRRELIAQGRCEERVLTPRDLDSADAVYLGNSLRGLIIAAPVDMPAQAAR